MGERREIEEETETSLTKEFWRTFGSISDQGHFEFSNSL